MPGDLPTAQLPTDHNWRNLISIPRSVPFSIRVRLAMHQFTFDVYFAIFFAAVPTTVGAFFLGFAAEEKTAPAVVVFIGTTVLLIGLSVWLGIAITLLSRSMPYVNALKYGNLVGRKITHAPHSVGNVVVYNGFAVDSQQFPWLVVNRRGRWRYALIHDGTRTGTDNSLVQSLLVVAPTFLIATMDPWITGDGLYPLGEPLINSVTGKFMQLAFILLFTWSHAVIPAFVLGGAVGLPIADARQKGWTARHILAVGFLSLFMLLYFGAPIALMFAMVGWAPALWAAGHILLAPRGTRRWVYVEYGSTSLALALYLSMFAHEPIPFGIVSVVGQILLLTFLNLKARPLWVITSKDLIRTR